MRTALLLVLLLPALACEESAPTPHFQESLFDFELPYFWVPGHVVKDHAILHDGTRFHLFSILNVLGPDETPVERAQTFAHATSPDLRHWTLQAPVLSVDPGWREQFVWAPFLVPVDGTYRMYFTGVNQFTAQCTGLARSADLFVWDVEPAPIHHPDPGWAVWADDQWSDGRDPMVLRHEGTWIMVTSATARTADGPRGAVACAISADGLAWTDVGPLLTGPGPAVPESPFLVHRAGVWHLFVSWGDEDDIQHRASSQLRGDWAAAVATSMQRGHASEVFQHDGQWWLSRFDGYRTRGPQGDRFEAAIRFQPISWPADPLAAPDLDGDRWGGRWEVISGTAFGFGPGFGENPVHRGEAPLGIQGSFYLSSIEAYHGPLRIGDPGDHHGDGWPLGVIRSATFELRHPTLLMALGGDSDPQGLWVRLHDASDNRVLAWTTGPGTAQLTEVRFDTRAHLGRDVYLEVVDATPEGGLTLDDIRGSTRTTAARVFHGDARRPR